MLICASLRISDETKLQVVTVSMVLLKLFCKNIQAAREASSRKTRGKVPHDAYSICGHGGYHKLCLHRLM